MQQKITQKTNEHTWSVQSCVLFMMSKTYVQNMYNIDVPLISFGL